MKHNNQKVQLLSGEWVRIVLPWEIPDKYWARFESAWQTIARDVMDKLSIEQIISDRYLPAKSPNGGGIYCYSDRAKMRQYASYAIVPEEYFTVETNKWGEVAP